MEANKGYKGWYIGSLMNNDIEDLHHKKNNRQYFEEFKNKLKENGIDYEDSKKTSAQVIEIIEKKIAIYFVGSTTWWGIQKAPISNLQNDGYSVKIVLFANTENPHYWIIDLGTIEDKDAKGRLTFSETQDGNTLNTEYKSKKYNEQNIFNQIQKYISGGVE